MSEVQPAAADPPAGRKGKLHGAAVTALREMIVTGALPPGARLREQELCDRLGISRTPLREAIRTLAREGLVQLLPNRSAVVAGLALDEVEALYDVVAAIEALAARQTCAAASDADIAEIAVLHHRMIAHYLRGELAAYQALNQEIHREIVRLARNPVLLEVWDMLAVRVRRARALANLQSERWEAAVREHEAMLAALRARDGDGLAAQMAPHFMNGLAVLKSALMQEKTE
jgi:DNA-binding GntR family transcriptional regulator